MARHSTTPLTTDDGCTHHETMLSVGAIHFQDRFCTSKIGGGGGHSPDLPCTWWLSWLAVEKPWLAKAGQFPSFLTQMGVEKLLCLCRSSISGTVHTFPGEAFTGQKALTIVSSLMSGHGRGHEP